MSSSDNALDKPSLLIDGLGKKPDRREGGLRQRMVEEDVNGLHGLNGSFCYERE